MSVGVEYCSDNISVFQFGNEGDKIYDIGSYMIEAGYMVTFCDGCNGACTADAANSMEIEYGLNSNGGKEVHERNFEDSNVWPENPEYNFSFFV
jgi:hypothetical protein